MASRDKEIRHLATAIDALVDDLNDAVAALQSIPAAPATGDVQEPAKEAPAP